MINWKKTENDEITFECNRIRIVIATFLGKPTLFISEERPVRLKEEQDWLDYTSCPFDDVESCKKHAELFVEEYLRDFHNIETSANNGLMN